MIVLKNIKKTNEDISAKYYMDGKDEAGYRGFLRIRLSDSEILEHDRPEMWYGWSHAKKELYRLGQMKNPPQEKTVLWY